MSILSWNLVSFSIQFSLKNILFRDNPVADLHTQTLNIFMLCQKDILTFEHK